MMEINDIVCPYTIETERVENGGNYWASHIVRIMKDGKEVFSYKRNYPSYEKKTFYPFMCKGKWYALYSSHYTCTNIVCLETREKIGGEKPHASGFCPVEFWVPKRFKYTDNDISYYIYEGDQSWDETFNAKSLDEETSVGPVEYAPFGFVSGCIWGDDSSWKIQFIDLSKADEGIIVRSDKFDYAEKPFDLTLKQSVNIEEEDEDLLLITLKVMKRTFVKF